jgi:hypothetical protein
MGVDEVTDAVPIGWYLRVQFDELLNPDIEELLPIPDSDLLQGSLAKSQPVVVSCAGANVPYDGYYNPSGNSLTWPLGPSLFIQPLDDSTIPAGAECNLMIKSDVAADKDGEHVPAAQLGPYTFKIAPMAFVSTDPAPLAKGVTKPAAVAPEDPVLVSFNTRVDPASLTAAEVEIRQVANGNCADAGTVVTPTIDAADKDPTSIAIGVEGAPDDAAFLPETTYVIKFLSASVSQAMVNGVSADVPAADKLTLCFTTGKLSP